MLYFVLHFAYFCFRSNKGGGLQKYFGFFEQLSSQKATFDFCLASFKQLFEKLLETF